MDGNNISIAPIRSWSSGRVIGDVNKLVPFFDEAENELNSFETEHRCLNIQSADDQSSASQYSDDDFCSIDTSESVHIPSSKPLSSHFHPLPVHVDDEEDKTCDQIRDHENIDHHGMYHDRPKADKGQHQVNPEQKKLWPKQHAMQSRRPGFEGEDRGAQKRRDKIRICQIKNRKGSLSSDSKEGIETKVVLSRCRSYSSNQEKDRVEKIREARRKHKQLYRKYLDSLKANRSTQQMERESAAVEAKEKRERIKNAVLLSMKSQSSTTTAEKDDLHKENRSTTRRTGESLLIKKHMENLLNVQKSWKLKKKEDENIKRRLQKRALILKKKYEVNLPCGKIWERIEPTSKRKADMGSSKHELNGDLSTSQSAEDKAVNVGGDDVQDKSMKLSKEMVAALTRRLSRTNGGSENDKISSVQIGGYKKIFSVIGCYPSIRNDLIERGWVSNDDRESDVFHLKFSLSSTDIDFTNMKRDQIVNHFSKSRCLTTKVGLCQTLSNCPLFAKYNSDKDFFFPRAYDLSRTEEIRCFVEDHHLLQTQGVLSRLLKRLESDCSMKVNRGIVKILCRFLRISRGKKNKDCDIDDGCFHGYQSFTPLESVVIQSSKDWIYRAVTEYEFDSKMDLVDLLQTAGVHEKPKGNGIVNSDIEKKTNYWRRKIVPTLSDIAVLDRNLLDLVRKCLHIHTPVKLCPQDHINGATTNNIWIIKPHGSSRGRGIKVSAGSLNEILEHVKPSFDGSKPHQFVIQKYIENPLTIQGRKFDLRQWVLVTNWNPLRVWFYNDCYVRFAVDLYEDLEDLESKDRRNEWENNPYKHMVNNSIGKKCERFKESFKVEETRSTVNGYMWSLDDFREWLSTKTGEDKWDKSLALQIKNIVIDSILCAQENMMDERKRCFEVYGFDIMIDANMHPWLIEVNSSPACDYSTPVTESYVKRALPDVLKVVLDIGWGSDCNRAQKDSGGWEMIHSGPTIPKVVGRFGSDMSLKGTPLRRQTRIKRMGNEKRREKRETDRLVFDDSDLSDYEKQYLSREVDKEAFIQGEITTSKSSGMNKENIDSLIRTNIKVTNPLKLYHKKHEAKQKNVLPMNTITLGIQL